MYLLHMAVITVLLVRGWTLDVPGGVVVDAVVTGLVIVMPCTVALAALGFASVERPFLSLRRRYVAAAPETAAPVPVPVAVAVAAEPARPRAELPSPRPDLPSHPNHRADSTEHTVRFTLTEERVGV
jgi:peptidoglycan/LPS O-acetylase OafA/YrhL